MPLADSLFDLRNHPAKADPKLVAADEVHFAAVARALEGTVEELSSRLDVARLAPAGSGQVALERDLEVHRLSSRLRLLRRYGVDLCLGRIVPEDRSGDGSGEPLYIGRIGLTDSDGRRLLVDWRSPAAEPFFAATHANPMGLASRRRYRWTLGRVGDYWDEVFTAGGLEGHAALDDQSAFIASLAGSRSPQMRDVLGTIQADQDAIIRAGSRGALVVDGGPGTGKTVVALHRSAYLLYSDPRLGHRRGGVLFVGPHEPYLAYVADVLPSLGEEGVRTCTLRDLLPEGAAAIDETEARVARIKSSAQWVDAIERAVRFYEEAPTEGMEISVPAGEIWVGTQDWADAFAAPGPGAPHNEARDEVLEELVTILFDKLDLAETGGPEDGGASPERVRAALLRNQELLIALNASWPLVEPTDLVADLWSVPAYLRRCAPWLDPEEIRALRRAEGHPWTVPDLPLLDLARQRLGDPEASGRRRRQAEARAAERREMDQVVEHLIADDDSEMHVMSMLRGEDLQGALDDVAGALDTEPDGLAGPFAHVVVDEAQELTDAEWQMLLVRCPSRSLTIVGDRAQARHGFIESWAERLTRIGLHRVALASLTINYRTPEEVMAEAEPVIRAAIPDVNVPVSIRSSGLPVVHASRSELDALLDRWLAQHTEGTACVVGDRAVEERPRVRSLTPQLTKGLEFDLVVLMDPDRWGDDIEGAVDRYVAMTRATEQLVVLTSR